MYLLTLQKIKNVKIIENNDCVSYRFINAAFQ